MKFEMERGDCVIIHVELESEKWNEKVDKAATRNSCGPVQLV